MAAVPLDEFLARMDQVLLQVPQLMLDALDANALSAKALIQKRIQETGAADSGVAFEDYTDDYKAYKQAQGKYKGLVDFTFTTNMWSSIGIIETVIGDQVVQVRVGGLDDSIRKQMQGLGKKRGNFMTLSEPEAVAITSAIADQFVESVNNLLR